MSGAPGLIGLPPEPIGQQPTYVRVLGLRALQPSATLCFVFFEGTVVLGLLLALAEIVPWWAVLVLPVVVAMMVKINDVVAWCLAGQPEVLAPEVWAGDLAEP